MPARQEISPMEALLVGRLPKGKDWRYEPKWDGFRCLAYKRNHTITLRSKSGKPLERYFPDIVSVLEKLAATNFVLDGELLVKGETGYSFSDLQMRLHPAGTRVHILETEKGVNLMALPLSKRRRFVEQFWKKYCTKEKAIKLSPQTDSMAEAMKWLHSPGWYIDGIVAKKVTDVYVPGQRVMQKYKRIRTADCVVGGFRYGTDSNEVGSLLLGLYDNAGRLNHVGFTSS